MIGTTINHYKILSRLGKGGMGEVYAAEDIKLKRKVALKVLPEEVSADPIRTSRFQKEAQAVAALNHPNIVTIHSVEQSDKIHFLTMELVQGDTLARLIPNGGFNIDTFLKFAIPISDALCAAHEKGIIHRDLKPANIMVNEEGRVKVLDFGLAKLLKQNSDPDLSNVETRSQTKDGAIVGTINYMSPEQISGQKLDHRSDIFSLGIILYEMITGTRPFNGASTAELISSILRDIPEPVKSFRRDLPEHLERVIRRCLMKDPNQRFQTVRDVFNELKELANEASAPSTSAKISASQKIAHNLPDFITHFVGRELEIAEIRKILTSARFITITGAGGAGKTRLAIEVASHSVHDFSDGVWLVNLGPISSGDVVVQTIAAALEIKEVSDTLLIDTLARYLHDKNSLLVIDSCEHVLDKSAEAIQTILSKASNVKVIATSRESLNLTGEQVWIVPPLSLPSQNEALTIDNVKNFDAIQLFIDRASANDPRFALTASNLESIVKICRRLDGIPLAIELAAARIKAMSVTEIYKRLDDCFKLLTSGSRASLQRHQTLRAAVDWSYDLLPETERILFRRLSCFSGFDLEAAENVCAYGDLQLDEILDGLARLVDKSLVIAERNETDSMRYRLLESLRQYTLEKLTECEELQVLQKRHFEYFANLADRAYEERIISSTEWLGRLERDHDNLRSAIMWASKNDPDGELRLTGAVVWFWHLHGHISEGRQRLGNALKRSSGSTAEFARALWGASMFASMQADHKEGLQLAEQTISIWRKLGNVMELALALEPYGWSLWYTGDNPGAYKAFLESLEHFQKLGDEKLINRATLNICQVLVSDWNVDKAEPMAAKALEIALQHNEARDIHNAHHYLADCALIRGDTEQSLLKYTDSLKAAMQYGDPIEMLFELEGISMSLAGNGQDTKALKIEGAVAVAKSALRINMTIAFWSELKKRYIDPAENRVGKSEAHKLKQEGAKMNLDAVSEYALDLNRN
jgi:non-specific serine/threonine protein kinase